MLVASLLVATHATLGAEHRDAPLVRGLDHVMVAVTDLDAAATRYGEIGFTLKPGRPHDNGIRNRHVKFPDGTEIELITASAARDALTSEYLAHLARGDGPAFVALYAPEQERLTRRLESLGMRSRRSGGLVAFPEADRLRHVVFGSRNHSPTDRPEHFRHRNGAEALIGVWIAGDDLGAERALLAGLGASIVEQEVRVPVPTRATVARLPDGEVVLLPGSRQLVPGRRVVGATVRTRSLDDVRSALAATPGSLAAATESWAGDAIFLPPRVTHGIWLELRERRTEPADLRREPPDG